MAIAILQVEAVAQQLLLMLMLLMLLMKKLSLLWRWWQIRQMHWQAANGHSHVAADHQWAMSCAQQTEAQKHSMS